MASSTIIFFYLMLRICPSFCRYGLVTKKIASEIECMYRLHHRLCSATPLDWLLSRNLKPRKLLLRAFLDFPRILAPMKITRHTVSLYLSLLFCLVPSFYQNLYKLVIAAVANICFSAYIHVCSGCKSAENFVIKKIDVIIHCQVLLILCKR